MDIKNKLHKTVKKVGKWVKTHKKEIFWGAVVVASVGVATYEGKKVIDGDLFGSCEEGDLIASNSEWNPTPIEESNEKGTNLHDDGVLENSHLNEAIDSETDFVKQEDTDMSEKYSVKALQGMGFPCLTGKQVMKLLRETGRIDERDEVTEKGSADVEFRHRKDDGAPYVAISEDLAKIINNTKQ